MIRIGSLFQTFSGNGAFQKTVSSGKEENIPSSLLGSASPHGTSGSSTVKWPPDQMPLSIIVPDSFEAIDLLKITLEAWESGSEGLITFQIQRPSDPPTIRPIHLPAQKKGPIELCWMDETTLGRPYETGHTQRFLKGISGWIDHVTITLIATPHIYQTLSASEQTLCLKATLLHELGHALGLEHSPNPRDVMYYRGWQNHDLTPGDIKALRQLYQSPSLNASA